MCNKFHICIKPLLEWNHTGENYWWGKIWQISYSQCICQMHFRCICEYWRGKCWRIAHNLPNSPIFPSQNFPMYDTVCRHLNYNPARVFLDCVYVSNSTSCNIYVVPYILNISRGNIFEIEPDLLKKELFAAKFSWIYERTKCL